MVMPEVPQWLFLFANGLVCCAAFIYAERYRRRTRSAVGYWLLLAGAATVINEPVVDVLGLCWFAKHGAIGLFTAWDVTVPAFMLPVYCWYVGGQALVAYMAIQKGATRASVYRLYGIFALVNIALELPGLNMGIYAYYGAQPVTVWGFPLWWPICNALMPITMAALASALLSSSWKGSTVLIVPLGPMAAGMTNGAIAIPVWVALNSGAPQWVVNVAAGISLSMGLIFANLIAQLVEARGPAAGGLSAHSYAA